MARTSEEGTSAVPATLALQQPPPPPPPVMPAAGSQAETGGPSGLESPTSSNTTEVLSQTVKGPFDKTAEEVDEEETNEMLQEYDNLPEHEKSTPPPSSDGAMEVDDLDLDSAAAGGGDVNAAAVVFFGTAERLKHAGESYFDAPS